MFAGINKEQIILILKLCRACSQIVIPKNIEYWYHIKNETLKDFNDLLKDLIEKLENDEEFNNFENDMFYSKIINELKEKFN